MKILKSNISEPIFGMSNMLGKYVKIGGPLNVSFYFGSKHAGVSDGEIPHGIRVKIFPNREKFRNKGSFFMKLHGDYSAGDNKMDSEDLNNVRDFFRKYKVLFAGAWEEQIIEDDITAYLRGRIDLHELIEDMYVYEDYKDVLDPVSSIEEFEQVVRDNKIFNMND